MKLKFELNIKLKKTYRKFLQKIIKHAVVLISIILALYKIAPLAMN